jgi:hypothetical protein
MKIDVAVEILKRSLIEFGSKMIYNRVLAGKSGDLEEVCTLDADSAQQSALDGFVSVHTAQRTHKHQYTGR